MLEKEAEKEKIYVYHKTMRYYTSGGKRRRSVGWNAYGPFPTIEDADQWCKEKGVMHYQFEFPDRKRSVNLISVNIV